jgi:hypothetical protein
MQHNRTTTSTLLLQPEINLTDLSPRNSPMRGSFEGLDSSTGSSLFLTEKKRVIGWNSILGDHEGGEDNTRRGVVEYQPKRQQHQQPQYHDQVEEEEELLLMTTETANFHEEEEEEIEEEDVTIVRKCKS